MDHLTPAYPESARTRSLDMLPGCMLISVASEQRHIEARRLFWLRHMSIEIDGVIKNVLAHAMAKAACGHVQAGATSLMT